MRLKKAFTLIEMLVVIAIIAILAGIIFPVFIRTKDAAWRAGDISNMNAIRTALQLYRVDQGGYPPALLGYVSTYTPGGNDVIPAGLIKGFLYPKRVDSIKTFQPAFNKFAESDTTTALWPHQDSSALGSHPIVDTDGDGKVTASDDKIGARQAYGYPANTLPVCRGGQPCSTVDQQLQFYKVSGYDVSEEKDLSTGVKHFELRYALFWSNWTIGSGMDPDYNLPYGNGSGYDDPRQLGYSEPPETTVVTWNDYFRDYQGNNIVNAKRDIVLFLGGSARPYASNLVADRSWRIMP